MRGGALLDGTQRLPPTGGVLAARNAIILRFS